MFRALMKISPYKAGCEGFWKMCQCVDELQFHDSAYPHIWLGLCWEHGILFKHNKKWRTSFKEGLMAMGRNEEFPKLFLLRFKTNESLFRKTLQYINLDREFWKTVPTRIYAQSGWTSLWEKFEIIFNSIQKKHYFWRDQDLSNFLKILGLKYLKQFFVTVYVGFLGFLIGFIIYFHPLFFLLIGVEHRYEAPPSDAEIEAAAAVKEAMVEAAVEIFFTVQLILCLVFFVYTLIFSLLKLKSHKLEKQVGKSIEELAYHANFWNSLGELLFHVFQDIKSAKVAFEKGLSLKESDTHPFLNMNLGHLCLIGEEDKVIVRSYLEHALAGFEEKSDEANSLRLAVELANFDKMEKYAHLTKKTFENSKQFKYATSLLMYALAAMNENVEQAYQQVLETMKSNDDYWHLIDNLYLLAGICPQTRTQSVQLVANLLKNRTKLTQAFEDKPKPKAWYNRYRRFAKGHSQGAGDPKDKKLFCSD